MRTTALSTPRKLTQATQRPHPLLAVMTWELRRFRASRLFWLQALGFFVPRALRDLGRRCQTNSTWERRHSVASWPEPAPGDCLLILPTGLLLLWCCSCPLSMRTV